jgi:pyridoxine 5-phosphate synthase
MSIRLGINIDHVATLRNARGGLHPSPVRAARLAVEAGADLITAHLREDRRHIRDDDMDRLKREAGAPLNMEMAVTDEMQKIAIRLRPHAVCLVPERRAELTTEGGLDVAGNIEPVRTCVKRLQDAGIIVSLFIDPDEKQLVAAEKTGATTVELHTGSYATRPIGKNDDELKRLHAAASIAPQLGLHLHAGHGLNFENVAPVASIPVMEELNIGHFLIGEAVFTGLAESVREMKRLMIAART